MLAGINEDTFHVWMRRGENPEADPVSDELFIQFSGRIRQAEAKCFDHKLATIKDAIDNGNVAVAQWFVERRMREDFGKSEDITLKNQHSGGVKIELNVADCGNEPEESEPN